MKIKRRKFLAGILSLGGFIATLGSYKWYHLNKEPNLLFFDSKRFLIASLAECIIPKSKDAAISETLISLIQNCADVKSQNRFVEGLSDLEERTRAQFNCDFIDCDESEKSIIITYYINQLNEYSNLMKKITAKLFGKPFITTLKDYTTRAFFTSEFGASTILNYSHIPTKYQGCITMGPNQPSWATE